MNTNEIEEPQVVEHRLPDSEGYLPREKWADGPWNQEADKYEWRAYGFPCLIVRGPAGALCGYVGVTAGHPWFKTRYSDLDDIEVHGGLTYSDECVGHVCHVPREGESDHVFWLGFDCAHGWDVVPGQEALLAEIRRRTGREPRVLNVKTDIGRVQVHDPRSTYKDVPYVAAQVNRLAEQALAATGARALNPEPD